MSSKDPINAALDEALHLDFENRQVWSVYADWFIERGHRRGELIHMECAPKRDRRAEERVVAACWSDWFGALSRQHVIELRLGFARALRPGPSVDLAVLGLPALRFLRRIELGHSIDLTVLQPFRFLVELRLPGALIDAVTRSALLGRLSHVELTDVEPEHVGGLVARRARFEHLGGRLSFVATESALTAHRDILRRTFPAARLAPTLPRTHADFGFRGAPEVHDQPRLAPANFRELPPQVTLPKRLSNYDEERWHGSGRPMEGYEPLRRCFGCASDKTLQIYGDWSSIYSGAECETYTNTEIEYVCEECGRFTSYATHRTS